MTNYFNSSIRRKKCKCSETCKLAPSLGFSGFAAQHAPQEIKDREGTKTRQYRKNLRKNLISKVRKLNDEEKKDKEDKSLLDLWFRLQINSHEKVCSNCGKSMAHFSDWAIKSSMHHVLDKATFPSVKLNPVNCLPLCVYECHSLWHSSMLVASKMPVFPKAIEIVKLLYPLLTEQEKGRVSEYYGI